MNKRQAHSSRLSEIEFDLKGLFDTFSALVGVDDGTNNERASVEFLIIGDGKELWRSGLLKKPDGAKPLRIDIAGVHRLVLRVTGASDTSGRTLSDWVGTSIVRGDGGRSK